MTTLAPKDSALPDALAATGFVYRGYSDADVAARANQQVSMYDSYVNPEFKFYKPPEGQNQIRILPATFDPPKGEPAHYGYPIYLHSGVGPGKGQTYLCPHKMLGNRCPVCDEWHRLERTENPDASEFALLRRVLFWMIDRKDEKAGPKLWSWSPTVDKEMAGRAQNRRTGASLKIDHPVDGYDVFFTRTGTTFKNTKYIGREIDREPSPLHEDERVSAQWIKFIVENPLPAILNFYEPEYLEQVMMGTTEPAGAEKEAPQTVRSVLLPAAPAAVPGAAPAPASQPAAVAAPAPAVAAPAIAPAPAVAPAAAPPATGNSALAAARAKIDAKRKEQGQQP